MDLEALSSSPVGQLVPISGTDEHLRSYSYFAFLPDPLPEEPNLSPRTWAAVTEAAAALAALKQACSPLPNPRLLIAPALAREAVDTSALEGTYAALPDVLEARLSQARPTSPEVLEIRAYEHMAHYAFSWVKERPITVSMLCDLQGILARDSKEASRDPGNVRRHQVLIGPENCAVEEARYIPPPPDDRLTAGLNAWEVWLNSESFLPAPIRCALAHYQFEALHPFGDGNGRVGRLVVLLQLLMAGSLSEPAISLSPWLLRRRTEYQDHLLTVSQTGDWNPWVTFFCRALSDQAQIAVGVVSQLMVWLANARQVLNERHWSGAIASVVEDLVDWPVITAPFVAAEYKVSAVTAKSVVDRLLEVGILKEMTGRPYKRVFAATDILRAVESM